MTVPSSPVVIQNRGRYASCCRSFLSPLPHFPTSSLPDFPTSPPPHFPTSPLLLFPFPLPHFPSSSLPPSHFPTSPLPLFTTCTAWTHLPPATRCCQRRKKKRAKGNNALTHCHTTRRQWIEGTTPDKNSYRKGQYKEREDRYRKGQYRKGQYRKEQYFELITSDFRLQLPQLQL